MEQLLAVARSLREDHDFRGYIHLKTIPNASAELIEAAGRYADRISINVELPTRNAPLQKIAPFIVAPDHRPAPGIALPHLRESTRAQLELFSAA